MQSVHRASCNPKMASKGLRRRLWLACLLALPFGCSPRHPEACEPSARTRAVPQSTSTGELAPLGYAHAEVVRITRDFGREDFAIALDVWLTRSDRAQIHDARLWWVKTAEGDRRAPFSERTQQHFDMKYRRRTPQRWDVTLMSDRKCFTFRIEVGTDGRPAAFSEIVRTDGTRAICRVSNARIVARRVLGVPTGIRRIETACEHDSNGGGTLVDGPC